ncbi:MAG: tRNA (cytidine(34)-2'-O)-methyltransferase [Bdellovibrionales bacterium]|nr:tRNA (cytidine(34)-2'-O)-methyltransferase [Bdellovibrionales bacterium]
MKKNFLKNNNFRVVLVEPEIPSNTGNIGRTCVATGTRLELVGPLGFKISSSRLKRAGLDYWPLLDWKYYASWAIWEKQHPENSRAWFFSTKGQDSLYNATFKPGDVLVFGRETGGLGKEILNKYKKQTLAIPMSDQTRSLNLSNAVAITLYEALRQTKSFSKD